MNFRRTIILLAVLSMMLIGVMPVNAEVDTQTVADYLANVPQGWGIVSVDAFATEMLETDFFILDVREPAELEELGHIDGAVHIPLRDLAANINLLPADLNTPIVVYCKSGHRGAIGMTTLQVLGYTNVRNLKGGIMAWIGADYPVSMEAVANSESADAPSIDAELVASVDNYLKNDLPQGWGMVSAENLAIELTEKPPFLLDVRETSEWEEHGYIEGAISVPLRTLGMSLDQLPDKSTPIVVYCHSGHRGAIAMTTLGMLGYDVRNLAGAIVGWENAGYPIVGGTHVEELDFVSHMDTYLKNGLPQGWAIVSVENLATELLENELFLLDVREAGEVEELGRIPGAVHIPLREVAANLNMLPADLNTPIVVYCKSGHRGAIGMTTLQVLGYTNVRNLKGGIMAWIGADYEVDMTPVEAMSGEMPAIGEELVTLAQDYLQNGLPQGWGMIQPDDLALQLVENPPFLLDVRETSEWEDHGYIEGAVNIPLRELAANLSKLPADQPIVIYCHSGHRGAIGMTVLQMLGYDVSNLAGAIIGWENAGYPIVGGTHEEVTVDISLPEGMLLAADEFSDEAFEVVTTIAMMPGFGTITTETLVSYMDQDIFILDVREDGEWAEGHIPGAIHIPLRELGENLHYLPSQDTPFVVYCAAGHRGAMAQYSLTLLGYDNVMNLRGGFGVWAGEVAKGDVMPVAGDFPMVDPNLWTTVNTYLTGLEGFGSISVSDFNTVLVEGSEIFIADVRETSEFDTGFIAEAVNLPMRTFAGVTEMLPETTVPVVVYDSSGPRGATVMTALQMLGYDAKNLGGGIGKWVNDGYAVVTK